jgi:hypothetical protein
LPDGESGKFLLGGLDSGAKQHGDLPAGQNVCVEAHSRSKNGIASALRLRDRFEKSRFSRNGYCF